MPRTARRRGPAGDPAAAGLRHLRLQQLIGSELALILRDDVTDPELDGVRITAVDLARDYSSARIWFALPAEAPVPPERRRRVDKALAHAAAYLRVRLGDALDLKRTPELRFAFDDTARGLPGRET